MSLHFDYRPYCLFYSPNKHKSKNYFCERCLHGYSRLDLLEEHKPNSNGSGGPAVKVEMPEEGANGFRFQNYHKQMNAPFVIYADFEALTTKLEGQSRIQSRVTLKTRSFTRYTITVILSYGAMVRQIIRY